MNNKKKYKPLKVILLILMVITLSVTFFLIREANLSNALTETEALNFLSRKLNDDRLGYMRFDDEEIEGEIAFVFKAFYNHDNRIETQGHYYVLKKTGNVFKDDVLGGKPIMIP